MDGVYQWIDLQLPLYRMMVPFLGIKEDPSTVELGYFNISEKDDETKINIAETTTTPRSPPTSTSRSRTTRGWMTRSDRVFGGRPGENLPHVGR